MPTQHLKPHFHLTLGRVLIFTLLVLPAIWALLQKGYFFSHDDIQVLRLEQMEQCFKYLQLPCRWTPHFGAGYGHPLFNYHPVLPYYLGMIFRLFGISFIIITKSLLWVSLYLSGLFFLLFASLFVSFPLALLGSILYVYAPYHAVDVYVRGALTEAWGLVFFPLILYALSRYLNTRQKKFFLLSTLALTGLFLSHNILTLLFIPVLVVFSLLTSGGLSPKNLLTLLKPLLMSVCLSAFFLLPAFFERRYVTIDFLTTSYYNFHDHFVTIRQLFLSRFWGYGGSRLGGDDELSFQIGWPHWWLVGFSALLFLREVLKKGLSKLNLTLIFFFLLFAVSLAFTHAKSVWFWDHLPLIGFVQFPWRFLSLVIFSASAIPILAGNYLPQKLQSIIAGLIIILTIALNYQYFTTFKQNPDMTDTQMLKGQLYYTQSRATLLDYMPINAGVFPDGIASDSLYLDSPLATVSSISKHSSTFTFSVQNNSTVTLPLTLPVFSFPIWDIRNPQGKLNYTVNEPEGTLKVDLPPGNYIVTGILTNTPLRKFSNYLSLLAFITLLIYSATPRRMNK